MFPVGLTVSNVPPLRGLSPHAIHCPTASAVGYDVSPLAGLEVGEKPTPFTKNVKIAEPKTLNSHPKVSILLNSHRMVSILRATDAPLGGWSG